MATTFQNIYEDIRTRSKLKESDDTMIKGYVNDKYKLIANKYPWLWLYETTTLVTTAKYNTGTISTDGTPTIPGIGTMFTSAMVGRKFKAVGFEEIYTIAAFVSTTEITLDNNFNGDDISDGSYEIFQDLMSLPSDLDSIVSLKQHLTPIKIDPIGIRELERYDPSSNLTTTDPLKYAYTEVDSSGNKQIILYPPPYRAMILDLKYKKQITELSADDDEPLIPEQYRQILKWGVMSDVFVNQKNDPRWLVADKTYRELLSDMLGLIKNTDDVMQFELENKRNRGLSLQEVINTGCCDFDTFAKW